MRSKTLMMLALPLAALLLAGLALAAGTPGVDWGVIGGGGGHLEQGIYTLDNTLSQPLAGTYSNGTLELCVGFLCGAVDATAPAAIADLSASTGTAPGTIDVSWTASGDDGSTGTASAYILRHNASKITAANWGSSTNVSGEPAPNPAGSAESMTVSGLTPGQTYWFAIKTRDEVPNTSDVSNSVSAFSDSYYIHLPAVLRNFVAYAEPCGPPNGFCEDHDTAQDAYGPLEPGVAYSAYPNDTNDYYFIVLLNTGTVTAQVTKFQAVGQLCLRYPNDAQGPVCDAESPLVDGQMNIQVLNLPAGTYFFQIFTNPGFENAADQYALTVTY